MQMYFIQIYFHLLWSGNKFAYYFVCISKYFVDPTRNMSYKGKQDSEKIESVKIRRNLKANYKSLTINSNLLHFNFTKLR